MRLILLSGGSGQRLWPISSEIKSKQFIKLIKNQYGHQESMLQRIWGQIVEVGLEKETLIVTRENQVELIYNQIGNGKSVVIEPERRDTFPAIALTAAFLYSEIGIELSEVVITLPVDTYVENNFFMVIKQLEELLQDNCFSLALIGVPPKMPSSQYGYILTDTLGEKRLFHRVSHFVEKPSKEIAESLVNSGLALWNCGVYAFKLEYVINILRQKGIPTTFRELRDYYSELPIVSFDYEIAERESNIAVVPYEGYWKDLGSWGTFTEELVSNTIGKGFLSDDCINSHMINELDIPVVVLGISNVVVAVTSNGILILDKNNKANIKDYLFLIDNESTEKRIHIL
ncbi:sugar phosphate nucleotidyltransferase [Paenibacillus sp. 32O-W]|uniref:sugar phosphate nucleotidyltransferase n=1 Tax=Paenibacillus sp. 32O-W TaxID=1695218 RepID=UPI00119FB2A1|nr:sugar phosphate nucleotidyltransferase [Paenibacillus sp. 32O-W]